MGVRWLKSSKLAPPSLKQRRFFNANFSYFSAHRTRSIQKNIIFRYIHLLNLILPLTLITGKSSYHPKPYYLIENLEILFLIRRSLEATPNGGATKSKGYANTSQKYFYSKLATLNLITCQLKNYKLHEFFN